jgi:hypothetical protein
MRAWPGLAAGLRCPPVAPTPGGVKDSRAAELGALSDHDGAARDLPSQPPSRDTFGRDLTEFMVRLTSARSTPSTRATHIFGSRPSILAGISSRLTT